MECANHWLGDDSNIFRQAKFSHNHEMSHNGKRSMLRNGTLWQLHLSWLQLPLPSEWRKVVILLYECMSLHYNDYSTKVGLTGFQDLVVKAHKCKSTLWILIQTLLDFNFQRCRCSVTRCLSWASESEKNSDMLLALPRQQSENRVPKSRLDKKLRNIWAQNLDVRHFHDQHQIGPSTSKTRLLISTTLHKISGPCLM